MDIIFGKAGSLKIG